MIYEIDGTVIKSEKDFHENVSALLGFGPYYGGNLNALWDMLSANVERPVLLVWKNSAASKEKLGPFFDEVVEIFSAVKRQDVAWGLADRFDFQLE